MANQMPNNIQDIYGSSEGVDFADAMAKALLRKGPTKMSAADAFIPGGWMQNVPDILQALSGAQYRDIMGSQAVEQTKRMINPNYKSGVSRYGNWARQPKAIAPGKANEPKLANVDQSVTTGSINQQEQPTSGIELQKQAYDYFVGKGWTPAQAAGIISNIHHESGFDIKNVGDAGKSHGLAQWNSSRLADLENFAGKSVKDTTFQEQLDFINHELTTGNERVAGDLLRKTTSPAEAAAIVSSRYERPKNNENMRRGKTAEEFFAKYGNEKLIPDAASNAAGGGGSELESKFTEENPVQTAQAQAPYTATPHNERPSGTVPPAMPLENTEQLDARLLAAPREQRQGIIDEYMKRARGEDIETPIGKRRITPQVGASPIVTEMANKAFPLSIGKLSVQVIPREHGGFGVITPDGKTTELKTFEGLMEWARQQEARDITVTGTAAKQATHYQDIQNDIQTQGEKSKLHLPMLNVADRLVRDPSFYSGVGENRVLDAKKVLDFLGMGNPSLSQPAAMEVFKKLVSSANLAAMEQLRGYGQVRSTDLRWLEESNANLSNRPEAIVALLDISKRMHQRSIDLQNEAMKYRATHEGNLDKNWDKHLSDWTNKNPLFKDKEIDDYNKKLKQNVNKPQKEENSWVTTPSGHKRRKIEE